MTILATAAYDAMLSTVSNNDGSSRRYYFTKSPAPTTPAEVATQALCAAVDASTLMNAIVAGVPDGRQYTCDGPQAVPITAPGLLSFVTITDLSDNPLLSVAVANPQNVDSPDLVNANSFIHRAAEITTV